MTILSEIDGRYEWRGHFFAKNGPAKNQHIFHVEHTQKTHLFALFHVFHLNITNKYFIKNIELTIGINNLAM